MFVDDTNLFFLTKTIEILFKTASRELKNRQWLKANKTFTKNKINKYSFFHLSSKN